MQWRWFAARRQETILLLGTLFKWIGLGALAGVAAGSASALFLWALDGVTQIRQTHLGLIWLLPLGGMLVGWAYDRYGREAAGGNNLILEQANQSDGQVPLIMAPFVLGGTLVTHLFGGSAGREGTAVQMGGSLADFMARMLALSPIDRRILLRSGVAGGFGSCFGTPLAGAVFGLEVTQVGGATYQSLVASFAASYTGNLVMHFWGIGHTLYPVMPNLPLSSNLLWRMVLMGAAAGLVSRLFAELVHGLKTAFRVWIPEPALRPLVGGSLVALILFTSHGFDYAGLSTPLLLRSFTPEGVASFAFLAKLSLTALTLGAGFQGGEVTPLFVMGATLGSTLAPLLGLPIPLAAGAGMVSVFASAANTPLVGIFLGAELFGGGSLPLIGITCIVAYILSGHGGIYTSQRVLVPKSLALPVPPAGTLAAARLATEAEGTGRR